MEWEEITTSRISQLVLSFPTAMFRWEQKRGAHPKKNVKRLDRSKPAEVPPLLTQRHTFGNTVGSMLFVVVAEKQEKRNTVLNEQGRRSRIMCAGRKARFAWYGVATSTYNDKRSVRISFFLSLFTPVLNGEEVPGIVTGNPGLPLSIRIGVCSTLHSAQCLPPLSTAANQRCVPKKKVTTRHG